MIDKKNLTKEEKDILSKIRKISSDAKKKSKLSYCLICGKFCSEFCNSHIVPEFVLRRIAVDGHVLSSIVNLDFIPIDDIVIGVKKGGIIHRICTECDNAIFKEYEKPAYLTKIPTDKVLNSIALKTSLKEYSKKLDEKIMLNYTEDLSVVLPFGKHHDTDKKEIQNTLYSLIKACKGKKEVKNKLVFWHQLDYVVPIACQTSIILFGDLDGYVVNSVNDSDSRHKMQQLLIVIFPLEQSSILMMFHNSSDTNYTAFDKQFDKLDLNEKLKVINYLIVSYSEEYFLSPTLKSTLSNESNEEIKYLHDVARDKHIGLVNGKCAIREFDRKELVKLKNRKPIANLLDRKYALL